MTGSLVAVLTTLGEHPEGITGYDIRKQISGHGPTVYNVLSRLKADGWIRIETRRSPFPGSPERKLNILTPLGVRMANEVARHRENGDPTVRVG